MLRKAKEFKDFKLRARDGDIGKAKEFYFDDENWTVRYLVADTGGWLNSRRVLISPYALDPANEAERVLPLDLTKKQIEESPSLSTDQPVSRQYEVQYYGYYGWPRYWGGPYTWGPSAYPTWRTAGRTEPARKSSGREDKGDPHLRSTQDVAGHHIQAQDGEIGHIQDFVIDDETWTIRYLVVDTSNWWGGKQVLVSTQWIERVSWSESKVFINLLRETIRQSPEYKGESLLTRDYETGLHRHYGRKGYWADEPTKPMRKLG